METSENRLGGGRGSDVWRHQDMGRWNAKGVRNFEIEAFYMPGSTLEGVEHSSPINESSNCWLCCIQWTKKPKIELFRYIWNYRIIWIKTERVNLNTKPNTSKSELIYRVVATDLLIISFPEHARSQVRMSYTSIIENLFLHSGNTTSTASAVSRHIFIHVVFRTWTVTLFSSFSCQIKKSIIKI